MPNGQGWKIAWTAPVAALRARIAPGQLTEGFSRDLRKGFEGLPLAGLEQHNPNATPSQLVRQCAASGAGPDDDDHARILEFYLRHVLALRELYAAGHRAAVLQRHFRQPAQIVEPAQQ